MNLIQQKLAEQISRLDEATLNEARRLHNPNGDATSKEMGNNVNRIIEKEYEKRN